MSTNSPAVLWPSQFNCSLIHNDFIYPNQYNISVSMIPAGQDEELFKIGFKKLKYFIYDYLDNSILIKEQHPLINELISIKNNTIQLPNNTNDLILATVLFHKFSAILKNNIIITEITIDSRIGDHVKYTVNTSNHELDKNAWWNNNGVETNDYDTFPSWDDLYKLNTKFEPKVVLGGKNENRSIR